MRKLYKFYLDCGRMGYLDGLFVATEEDIKMIIGKDIYFGEVLGKHSDVIITLKKEDLTIKSDDQIFINKLVEIIDDTIISGYSPLEYYHRERDNDESYKDYLTNDRGSYEL